jgi:hypothetical protein
LLRHKFHLRKNLSIYDEQNLEDFDVKHLLKLFASFSQSLFVDNDRRISRCQFHQHFMHIFFVQKVFARSFFLLTFWYILFWCKNIVAKLLIKCWWNWHKSAWCLQIERVKKQAWKEREKGRLPLIKKVPRLQNFNSID